MNRPRPHPHQKQLVEVIGEALGFDLPMREGTKQTVAKIHKPIIDALLAAGWEPTGLQGEYDAVDAERRRLRGILDEAEALAESWEERGYGVANGKTYATELRSITKEAT